MKIKVGFLDKSIWSIYYKFLAFVSVVVGIIGAFWTIDDACKAKAGLMILVVLLFIYVCIWIYINLMRTVKLRINVSSLEVSFGDCFSVEAETRAIAFNEYFDTMVDDVIISRTSLNGQYIEKYYPNGTNDLDLRIENDMHLKNNIVGNNAIRLPGKTTKYKLGTIFNDNGFFLVALTHFDSENKAFLDISDYINCLMNFWNEVDRLYANRTIVIPVLGSGITRFKGADNISDQELLELMIWTFKISRVKFAYPSKVKIVVWDQKSDRINLAALKKFQA